MKLWYTDGSPFARIIRATLLEFGLPHEAVDLGFPLPDIPEVTPALQVPVLEHNGRKLFGTELIRAYLHELAVDGELARPLARPGHKWDDLQVLYAIHAANEAVVTHHYARWSGTGASGPNRLGIVPAERSLQRALSLLDWLEGRIQGDGFWPDAFCAADLALACFLLWTESRGPIDWRGRPGIEALVERVGARESLRRTQPRAWSPT